MARATTDTSYYQAIAAAIRQKNGGDTRYRPSEMAAAILDLRTGYGDFASPAIVWLDAYNNILDVKFWDGSSAEPSTEKVPVKVHSDESFMYLFEGWVEEQAETGNVKVYKPVFTEVARYTVTWRNWDGTILYTEVIRGGTVPSYSGPTPVRTVDDQHRYVFSGWDPAVSTIDAPTTYTAQYEAVEGYYVARQAMRLNELLASGDNNVHPAFICNGVQTDTLYIGKYEASVANNCANSLKVAPKTNVSFDDAVQYCRNNGVGHHLITAAEWGYLALLAKKRGTQPEGNNNSSAVITQGNEPLTYSDTGDATGVMNLNGNVWEMCAGLRLVYGELQVIPYNNAADPTVDMSATSTAWKALNATATSYDDLYITPNGSGTTSGSVKLDYVSSHWQWAASATSKVDSSRSAKFALTTASGLSDFCKMYLQAMALLPEDGDTDYGDDIVYAKNGADERMLFRGGGWRFGAGAGVFTLYLNNTRSYSTSDVGFRAAFENLKNSAANA